MQNNTEEIKARIDIVDLIQSYVRLAKAGVNYKAPCPFHSEKTASFIVSPAKQIWHCFGCNRGGDQFTFIMEIEGVEFPEALKLLADRAGIKLVREDPALGAEKNRLLAICEEAAKFFEEVLSHSPQVTDYLHNRGLTDETIRQFRVGFVQDEWRSLFDRLAAKNFKAVDIEKAGLAIKNEQSGSNNRYYDRFRGRIIFPITDANARVIGFGGRIFEAPDATSVKRETTGAKYINTPQTPIYDKSRVLYAFDKAKQDIRKKNSCVLVEGYMDAVMSHQARVTNAVAVSGTALTQQQLAMIRRLAEELISSFDSDSAGEMATKRSLDIATSYDFVRKVAVVPKELGKDPADIVKENPETWMRLVENAEPVMDFYFRRAGERYDVSTAEGKKNIGRMLLPEIARLANEIERAHWVTKIASLLHIPEEAILKELLKQKTESAFLPEEEIQNNAPQKTRGELLEERLLGLMLIAPEIRQAFAQDEFFAELFKSGSLLHDTKHKKIFAHVCSMDPASFDRNTIYAHFADEEVPASYIKQLALGAEIAYEGVDKKRYIEEAQVCFREIAKTHFKNVLQSLAGKIESAEAARNTALLDNLMHTFQEVSQKLTKVSTK